MKNTMRQKHLLIMIIGIALWFTLSTPVHAKRQKVTCTFTIQEDAGRNVKANTFTKTKKVRRREYNRLVESGENAYRVVADGGYHCIIRHIENIKFRVRIDKRDMKLRPEGRIPVDSHFK